MWCREDELVVFVFVFGEPYSAEASALIKGNVGAQNLRNVSVLRPFFSIHRTFSSRSCHIHSAMLVVPLDELVSLIVCW